MNAPHSAARKATVIVTIEAPWTSFIVVSTSPPPGSPMQPRRRLGAGDRAGDEEERQHDEQDEQQRAPGLLAESQPGRGGHARVHARLLAEATKTQNAAASAPTVTIASLTQSPVGEPIPVPAAMRMSAAFWLTAHGGGDRRTCPGRRTRRAGTRRPPAATPPAARG